MKSGRITGLVVRVRDRPRASLRPSSGAAAPSVTWRCWANCSRAVLALTRIYDRTDELLADREFRRCVRAVEFAQLGATRPERRRGRRNPRSPSIYLTRFR